MAHHWSYIVTVVDLVKNGHHEKAMLLCEEAKKELAFLIVRMNIMDKKKIDYLDRFIDDIQKNNKFGVTMEIIAAKSAVEKYYQEENRKTQADQTKQPTLNTSMVQNENQTSLSQSSRNTRKEQEEIKVDKNEKHERKQDLTVVERGLKAVAIAFYNLFDDEWGSAFEELDDNITEKEKVQILHEVVQKAYDFNKGKKESLLEKAEDSAKAVVNSMGSEQKWKCDSTGAKDENALFAVPQLQMTFRDTKVKDMNKKWSEFLKKRGIIHFQINATYIDKCVLLTWLICIEDPPIHMSYGKVNDELDTKLYEPFLKKGKYIDYIAWPALQHTDMNGSVLVKGRARGKDKCD